MKNKTLLLISFVSFLVAALFFCPSLQAAHAAACTDPIGCAENIRASNGSIFSINLSSQLSPSGGDVYIGNDCIACQENGNNVEPSLILNAAYTFQLKDANGNVTGNVTGPGTFGPYLASTINHITEVSVPATPLSLYLYTDPEYDPDPAHNIDVFWQMATLNQAPAGANSDNGDTYYLSRSTTQAGLKTATPLAITNSGSSPYTYLSGDEGYDFVDTNSGKNLAPQTTYYYQIQGKSASGSYTSVSNVASIQTEAAHDSPAPPTPTGPTNLVATATGTSTVALSWTAATNNPNLAGYLIYRDTNADMHTAKRLPIPNAPGNYYTTGTAFSDTTIQPGTIYYYQVFSDDSGTESDSPQGSNVASATALLILAPSNLTAVINTSAPNHNGIYPVSLSWVAPSNDPNLTQYVVYCANLTITTAFETKSLETTYTDPSSLYGCDSYYVAGQHADGSHTPASNIVIVDNAFNPGDLTASSATSAGSPTVTLLWVPPFELTSGSTTVNYQYPAVSYQIYRSVDPMTFPGTMVALVNTPSQKALSDQQIEYTDTSVSAGQTYYYHIRAAYYSNPVQDQDQTADHVSTYASVAVQVPSAGPSDLSAIFSVSSKPYVQLSWGGPAAATSYSIERSLGSDDNYSVIGTTLAPMTDYQDNDPSNASSTDLNDVSESYRVRALFAGTGGDPYNTTYSDYSNVATVKNCVLVSGSGPNTIVFIRGDQASPTSFLSAVNNIIQYGYLSVDPFKAYGSSFSFYADMISFPQSNLGKSSDPITFDHSANDAISSYGSACVPGAFEYIFLFDDASMYSAWTQGYNSKVVFENLDPKITQDTGPTLNEAITMFMPWAPIIHETGHAVADLDDEYYTPNKFGSDGLSAYNTNCTKTGLFDANGILGSFYDSLDNRQYGSGTDIGCAGYVGPMASSNYYRPSINSIMAISLPLTGLQAGAQYLPSGSVVPSWNQFNIISCGYLVAAILGEPTDHAHAQLHWPAVDTDPAAAAILGPNPPGCNSSAMNTTKDGVFSLNPLTPITQSINTGSSNGGVPVATPGDPTITGIGFTPTGNSVELTSVTDPTQVFQVNDIPSSDGKTLTFILSAATIDTGTFPPTGLYQLRTGAFNSAWSAPILMSVENIPPPPPLFSILPTRLLPPLGPYVAGIPITISVTAQNMANATTVPVSVFDKNGFGSSVQTSFNAGETKTIPISLMLTSGQAPSDALTISVGNVSTTTTIAPITSTSSGPLPLSATCYPSATTTPLGSSITWTAYAAGGTAGPSIPGSTSIYSFAWSGTSGLVGYGTPNGPFMATTSSISQIYSAPGPNIASVTVMTTGGQQVIQSCGNIMVTSSGAGSGQAGFSIAVVPPASPVYAGTSQTFVTTISGQRKDPVRYAWNFGNNMGLEGNSSASTFYLVRGTYPLTVTATDANGVSAVAQTTVTVINQPISAPKTIYEGGSSGNINTENNNRFNNGNDDQSLGQMLNFANVWDSVKQLLGV